MIYKRFVRHLRMCVLCVYIYIYFYSHIRIFIYTYVCSGSKVRTNLDTKTSLKFGVGTWFVWWEWWGGDKKSNVHACYFLFMLFFTHVGASLLGCLFTQPLDVVKTRMMTQAASNLTPYSGYLSICLSTYVCLCVCIYVCMWISVCI